MEKTISIQLDEHLTAFIDNQIRTGNYSSERQVVESALRILEQKDILKNNLLSELEEGENSKKIHDFDRYTFLEELHNDFYNDQKLNNQA